MSHDIIFRNVGRDQPMQEVDMTGVPDYVEFDCDICGGTGLVKDKPCDDCDGTGRAFHVVAVTIYPKGDPRGQNG